MNDNSLQIFLNTYRLEYKTKYSNISIAILKFVDECAQYSVPIKEFMIKETVLLIAKELNLPNIIEWLV